jgi:hypothetical protein
MPNRAESLDKLKRDIEAKVEAIDVRLTATERLLAERQAAAEPVDAPLLPILRPRRPRKKS